MSQLADTPANRKAYNREPKFASFTTTKETS
jgi:hypothetical protein